MIAIDNISFASSFFSKIFFNMFNNITLNIVLMIISAMPLYIYTFMLVHSGVCNNNINTKKDIIEDMISVSINVSMERLSVFLFMTILYHTLDIK